MYTTNQVKRFTFIFFVSKMIHATLLFYWYSHTIFTPLNDHHRSNHCRLEAAVQTKERSSLPLPSCRGCPSESLRPGAQEEGERAPSLPPAPLPMAPEELEPAPGHSASGCCLQDRELVPTVAPGWLSSAWPVAQTGAEQLEVLQPWALGVSSGQPDLPQAGHAGMLEHRWNHPSGAMAGQGRALGVGGLRALAKHRG